MKGHVVLNSTPLDVTKMAMDVLIKEEQNLIGKYDEPSLHLGAFFVRLPKCSMINLATLYMKCM